MSYSISAPTKNTIELLDGKNRAWLSGDTVRVELTRGQSAYVDYADWNLVKTHRWHAIKPGEEYYAEPSQKPRILMHRMILGLSRGDGLQVDHIDHNGLNNQRSNLRIVNHQTNQFNSRSRKNTSSKYKGVSWYKRIQKWQVYVDADGKRHFGGLFKSETEAALRANELMLKVHGKFANLNEINADA